MTARLVRLRIAGFKSFAEPVSLDILPGLTGIVGPNGCGKSNVADALRWAMGETSARSLRGGEMDDVIFSGTTARASRNLAEVSVSLEAGDNKLPAPFDAEAELQITRRIERGAGSTFRANGRELRARDVQTLYADLASGARSSGMVSQGRVAALVAAKPEERRQVLEEAAGIAGLHARRHEAELKLRAAEQNLGRADDTRTELDAARDNLRKQARQAARYRGISDLIRAAEAEHLAILHGRADSGREVARTTLEQAQSSLEAAEAEHQISGAALADAEAALPSPRQREAEARAVLERRRVEAESLAGQAAAARAEHEAAQARLRDLGADLAAAGRVRDDASETVARLGAEAERLDAERAALPDQLGAAREASRETARTLGHRRAMAEAAHEEAASAARQTAQAEDVLRHAAARAAEFLARHKAAEGELAAVAGSRVPHSALEDAQRRQTEAHAAYEGARARLEAAEAARAEAASRAAATASHAARQHASRREAEAASKTCAARLAEAAAACAEAEGTLTRLRGEGVNEESLTRAEATAHSADAALALVEDEIDAAERAFSFAREAAAEARRTADAECLARQAAEAARDTARARLARAADQSADAARAWEAARAGPPEPPALDSAFGTKQACDRAWAQAEETARQDASRADEASRLATLSRDAVAEASAHEAKLSAEAAGLAAALGPEQPDGALSALNVPAGLEQAVGAALGAAADSGLRTEGASFWRALPPLAAPEAPPGTALLSAVVQAPDAFARALSHAALLEPGADGDAMQARLAPGMVVVDRDGACWRWDGHVTRAGAPNQAATRFLLRQRLDRLAGALLAAQDTAKTARTAHAERTSAAEAAVARAECSLAAAGRARQDLTDASAALEALRTAARRRDDQIEASGEAARRLRIAWEDATRDVHDAEAVCAALPHTDMALLSDLESLASSYETALEQARLRRLSCRTQAVEARRAMQALAGEAARALALIEAASATAERAAAGREAARANLRDAEAALAGLPDPGEQDAACTRLSQAERACRAEEAAARGNREGAERGLEAARHAAMRLQLAHGEAEARWTSLSDVHARAAADLAAGEQALAEAEQARNNLADAASLLLAAQDARDRLDGAQRSAAEAQARVDGLTAALAQAERSAPGIASELTAWRARLDEAEARHRNLAGRHASGEVECATLSARPASLETQAARLHQALAAASATHLAAEAALEAAHGRVRALAGAERDAAREAGSRRERLARAQAALESAAAQLGNIAGRIAERLGPGARLPEAPDLSDAALDRATRRTERLTRERDEMGPVNLRAELEMAELDERLAALARDQEELTTAIAKLRGAIGHLNREGRERLKTVFSEVDRHFRALFTRMMGGGQAHLAWTGSDDVLEAGLDIFAEPPGKKLTSLSLLSGGEQALTALSLIFSVFRCQPAPLCVLDEVDAPLDDANVDRFCALLEEMARETGTSFLVVTHHQLTMSRMDRLYGVTMQERGVSRLLSVDLSRAVALAEPARVAAE